MNGFYVLSINEARRYKITTACAGQESKQVLKSTMRSWIRYFATMKNLVSDQESSLMTVGASDLEQPGDHAELHPKF